MTTNNSNAPGLEKSQNQTNARAEGGNTTDVSAKTQERMADAMKTRKVDQYDIDVITGKGMGSIRIIASILDKGIQEGSETLIEIRNGVLRGFARQINDSGSGTLCGKFLLFLPETGAMELLETLQISLPPLHKVLESAIRSQCEWYVDRGRYKYINNLIKDSVEISGDVAELADKFQANGIQMDTSDLESKRGEVLGTVLLELLEDLCKGVEEGKTHFDDLEMVYNAIKEASENGTINADISKMQTRVTAVEGADLYRQLNKQSDFLITEALQNPDFQIKYYISRYIVPLIKKIEQYNKRVGEGAIDISHLHDKLCAFLELKN